jgi:hypothetical protein
MAVGTTTSGDTLDEREIHDVLRNDRRRLAIEMLREEKGVATVRDLSEKIATEETGERPPPRDKRQSVYVSLHQTHLPKLDTLGIVSYDPSEKEVYLEDRVQEIEVYMEVVPQYGLSWAEFYFGFALLGLLTVVAVLVGVPGISGVGITVVSSIFFLALMCLSAYHVYTQQDRIVFQRLLE